MLSVDNIDPLPSATGDHPDRNADDHPDSDADDGGADDSPRPSSSAVLLEAPLTEQYGSGTCHSEEKLDS